MKKILFLMGLGVGFVLGSRSGRGPYEQLERKMREVSGRPEVQQLKDAAQSTTQQAADSAASKMETVTAP